MKTFSTQETFVEHPFDRKIATIRNKIVNNSLLWRHTPSG